MRRVSAVADTGGAPVRRLLVGMITRSCTPAALATLHVLLGHVTHPVTKRDGALDERRRESHAFRAPLWQKWGFGAAPGTLTVIGLSAKEVRG